MKLILISADLDDIRRSYALGVFVGVASNPSFVAQARLPSEQMVRRVLDAVSIPVFIYNNPKATGVTVKGKLRATLADFGVAGIKDSSFEIISFWDLLWSATKPDFIPVIGTEALILPRLAWVLRQPCADSPMRSPSRLLSCLKPCHKVT